VSLLVILVRRVLQIMATVLLVAVRVLTLMHLLPDDPAQVMLGHRGSTAAIAQRFWCKLCFNANLQIRSPLNSLSGYIPRSLLRSYYGA
jgi:ABC-type dipeptide/oligopeptide/nickel transport system permease component